MAVPIFILVPRWLITFEVLPVDLENTPHKSLYNLYNIHVQCCYCFIR